MKNNHSAPKGKEKSEKTNMGAKGGTTKMFGPQDSSPSVAGTTAGHNGRKAPNNKFGLAAKGRTGVMGKQRGAAPAVAGQISSGGRGGDNKWGISGGKGHMAGFSPVANAKAK